MDQAFASAVRCWKPQNSDLVLRVIQRLVFVDRHIRRSGGHAAVDVVSIELCHPLWLPASSCKLEMGRGSHLLQKLKCVKVPAGSLYVSAASSQQYRAAGQSEGTPASRQIIELC